MKIGNIPVTGTGQWAPYKQWSDNPAWVFYDMMTSRRYGLQKYGFGEDIVDKWNLYSIAKYCDELVETGYRPANIPLSFSIDPSGAVVFCFLILLQMGGNQN